MPVGLSHRAPDSGGLPWGLRLGVHMLCVGFEWRTTFQLTNEIGPGHHRAAYAVEHENLLLPNRVDEVGQDGVLALL